MLWIRRKQVRGIHLWRMSLWCTQKTWRLWKCVHWIVHFHSCRYTYKVCPYRHGVQMEGRSTTTLGSFRFPFRIFFFCLYFLLIVLIFVLLSMICNKKEASAGIGMVSKMITEVCNLYEVTSVGMVLTEVWRYYLGLYKQANIINSNSVNYQCRIGRNIGSWQVHYILKQCSWRTKALYQPNQGQAILVEIIIACVAGLDWFDKDVKMTYKSLQEIIYCNVFSFWEQTKPK